MNSRAEEKLVVVPYQPGLIWKRRLLTFLAMLVGIAIGIVIGWHSGSRQHLEQISQIPFLQEQLANAQQQEKDLNQEIAILERGRAVDDAANREVQTTILELENSIVQLKEDIAFYKNIMAPAANVKGLKVQKLNLWQGGEVQAFRYKLVLTQVSDNRTYIEGVVAVNLIGTRDGEKEILPLRDVEGAKDLGVKFRFRYFQDIEGDLILPEGFKVAQVQVVAQAVGKKATKIERTFDWKVGD